MSRFRSLLPAADVPVLPIGETAALVVRYHDGLTHWDVLLQEIGGNITR